MNPDSEDGLNDNVGGMTVPWGTPNSHDHGPGSLYQNYCSAVATAAAEELASIESQYTSSANNVVGRPSPQVLLNNAPTNLLSRDGNDYCAPKLDLVITCCNIFYQF